MTAAPFVHPEGFYKAYPLVTWDLAEERWLGDQDRSDWLVAVCLTCGWVNNNPDGPVLAKPERRQVAEFIAKSQHWYECPGGDPRVECGWLRDLTGESWPEAFGPWISHVRAWQGKPDIDAWIRQFRDERST